jgi:hypothetical protein
MSVTYGNDPAHSNLDLVRVLVQDTTGRLSDETINCFLTSEPSVWYAAAMCADTLAGLMGGSGSLTVGDLSSVSWLSAPQLRSLAKSLRVRGSQAAVPFAGGIKVSDKDTEKADTDRVPHAFAVGMHDDQGSTYGI